MRFQNAFVRGTAVGPVSDDALTGLAAALAEAPVEVVLTSRGALRGDDRLGHRPVATALARRNVRSLLSRSSAVEEIAAALRVAVDGPPVDAEYALEDAGLELNLRYSIFATSDAVIRLEGLQLVVSDGSRPTIEIPRAELRDRGRRYFCPEAVARLASFVMAGIEFSASAVLPLALQLPEGALMGPDVAEKHVHKRAWRAMAEPRFDKALCRSCACCFVHCPDNAIVHAAFDAAAPDTTGVLGIDYERCTACGICAAVCGAGAQGRAAITMTRGLSMQEVSGVS